MNLNTINNATFIHAEIFAIWILISIVILVILQVFLLKNTEKTRNLKRNKKKEQA